MIDYSSIATARYSLVNGLQFPVSNPAMARYRTTGQKNLDSLTPLEKINIFVGPNNGGKSQLMRGIASHSAVSLQLNATVAAWNDLLEGARHEIRTAVLGGRDDVDVNNFMHLLKNAAIRPWIREKENFSQIIQSRFLELAGTSNIDFTGFSSIPSHDVARRELRRIGETYKSRAEELARVTDTAKGYQRIYFPILRNLRGLENARAFEEQVRKDYFKDAKEVQILTGQTLYGEFRKMLLGDLDMREQVAEYQEFLSEFFFNGKKVALIPREDSDALYIRIGTESEQPIYHLGDGINALVLLTASLFIRRNSASFVFIEEPEMFLHAGMQRMLIETLATHDAFALHQFFLATHSNHILDLTLDRGGISIFTVRKSISENNARVTVADFTVENVSNDDHRALELLGVQASSVFLSNCTIWVEGITDRRFIQHIIKLLDADTRHSFKEDLHYSFVEYSGNNITHWSFLDPEAGINVKHLCSRLFLVADRDDEAKPAKALRHQRLLDALGDRYYRLSVLELENLISPKVLMRSIRDLEPGSKESIQEPSADYSMLPLGEFIEGWLDSIGVHHKKYRGDSGTINNKTRFWDTVIANTLGTDDLSDEARLLGDLVLNHVRKCNPRHELQ